MIVPLKDKKYITTTNAFHENLDKPRYKTNKTLSDKGSEFYDRSIKLWLQDNRMEIYSTHNEGISDDDGRFIRTLKKKAFKLLIGIIKKCVYC